MASDGTAGGSDRNNQNLQGKPAASSRHNRGGSIDEASNNNNNNNNNNDNNNINISMRERSDRNNDNDNNHRPPSAAAAAASAPARSKAGAGWLRWKNGGGDNRNDNNNNDDNNNDAPFQYAAAARGSDPANNDNNNEDEEEEDSTLKRLLHRLKREHISNFGKHSGTNSRPNEQRARYLLEASAGNVGLAAALYWEDYIQNRGDEEEHGGNENSSAVAVAAASSSVARKRSREETNSSSSSATTAGAVAAAKKPARRKTTGLTNNNDDNDDDNNNNNSKGRSKLSSMRQFQELGEKLSSLQERLSSLSDNNNPEQRQLLMNNDNNNNSSNNNNNDGDDINVDEMLASSAVARGAAAGRRNNNADSNADAAGLAAAAAAGGGGANNGAAPLPFANMNAAQQPPARDAAAAAAAAMYPDIMRLGLSEGELSGNLANALDAADASLAAAAAARAEWMGAGAMFGSTRGSSTGEAFNAALAAALQGEQLLPRYLMNQQQGGGGSGGGEADPPGGVWDQIVSRALANPGRQLESDEARAFLAALAADSANVGANNAAVAAAAGGNGGNPDDDGDNDDDNDSMGGGGGDGGGPRHERDHERDGGRDNDNADDNNAEAPLRRSLRLRSARRRDAARAVALEIANRRANRRVNRRNNNNAAAAAHAAGDDHNVSGSEDDTFMPGPVPVFRKGASSSATKCDSTPSKRKKLDDLVSPRLRLHGHSDDESDNEFDDESVDIDDFLYGSEDYPDPSRVLWESFPIENIEGENIRDDDTPRVPFSWLRSGFKLSTCGNGLAMSEPKEDEWDIIRRSLPQNIRDGPLKGVKTLFPYNCKGVSAMLSLVTALLYSGVSLQKGTISIGVDRVPFDELPLEERRMQFDVRLEDALSALIFVAAKAGAQRCKNKLVEYDKFLARRKMDPEEQSFYLQRRQQLEKRTHLCNVCWWDVDSTTGTTSFPAGKDPIDVNVNNSFTNINDIKSYVRTHLRSFKEPGGCALLLETIIRCHGVEYTEQTFGGEGELLSCNCKESLKHVRNSNTCTKPLPDDCMTPKLLSLLLTGEARTSYQNWSGDIFGIGVLRMNNNEPPNNQLLRPIKQIWLCQGDTGYSLLFLKKKKLVGREDSLDQPGKAFHWNCWSAELSSMKISAKVFGAGPVSSPVSDDSEGEGRTVMDSIFSKIRSEHRRNLASPWADIALSSANASRVQHNPITDDELTAVKFHPDDEKYYPEQYRRWRFHFGTSDNDSTIPADAWIPFYRLRERERLVVEMKLAPRIVALVRSRWPMAEVTDFSPRGQYPIV